MPLLSERTSLLLLCGVLAGMGTLHLVHPEPFDELVPRPLGAPRIWTYASGIAELTGASLLGIPRTRRLGGWFVAGLFIAIFPGNLKAALDGGMQAAPAPLASAAAAWIRLPLQLPLILWALRHARGSGVRSGRRLGGGGSGGASGRA